MTIFKRNFFRKKMSKIHPHRLVLCYLTHLLSCSLVHCNGNCKQWPLFLPDDFHIVLYFHACMENKKIVIQTWNRRLKGLILGNSETSTRPWENLKICKRIACITMILCLMEIFSFPLLTDKISLVYGEVWIKDRKFNRKFQFWNEHWIHSQKLRMKKFGWYISIKILILYSPWWWTLLECCWRCPQHLIYEKGSR